MPRTEGHGGPCLIGMDPAELRRHYGSAALRRRDFADDPIAQFRL
jgi:hypothetical protein